MHKEHKHVKGKQKWLVFYFGINNSPVGLSKAMTKKGRKELWVFSLYNVSVFHMEFPGGQDILLKIRFMSLLMKAWQITSHLSVKIKGTSTQLASYFDGKTSMKKQNLKDLEKKYAVNHKIPYVLWNCKIISNIFLSYKNSRAKKKKTHYFSIFMKSSLGRIPTYLLAVLQSTQRVISKEGI